MNVNKSIYDICKEHIDSLTPEEREEEYFSMDPGDSTTVTIKQS